MTDHFKANKIAWGFYKRHIENVTNNNEDWEELFEDMNRTFESYPNEYMKALLFAQADEFERIYYSLN